MSGAGTVGKLFELAMPEMLESFACRAWLPNNEQQHVAGRPCDGGRATEASGFPIFRRDAYAIRAQPLQWHNTTAIIKAKQNAEY